MTLRTLPRVVPLALATVVLPASHPEAARNSQCPVFGYAIDHPDGVILFDTGVGADSTIVDELYQPQVTLLDAALATHGISLSSVTAVVNSHLHFDHCGQNPRFHGSEVPLFAGRQEFASVRDDPVYTVAQWAVPPEPQQRVVDGDVVIADGITILEAPGHTAGHVALMVEGGGERTIIAGQAVWHASEFADGVATPANVTEEHLLPAAHDTINRLKSLGAQHVYFSHCESHWSAPAESS